MLVSRWRVRLGAMAVGLALTATTPSRAADILAFQQGYATGLPYGGDATSHWRRALLAIDPSGQTLIINGHGSAGSIWLSERKYTGSAGPELSPRSVLARLRQSSFAFTPQGRVDPSDLLDRFTNRGYKRVCWLVCNVLPREFTPEHTLPWKLLEEGAGGERNMIIRGGVAFGVLEGKAGEQYASLVVDHDGKLVELRRAQDRIVWGTLKTGVPGEFRDKLDRGWEDFSSYKRAVPAARQMGAERLHDRFRRGEALRVVDISGVFGSRAQGRLTWLPQSKTMLTRAAGRAFSLPMVPVPIRLR